MRRPLDTGPLSELDLAPPKDYAQRRTAYVRNMNSNRDWLAISVAVITMVINIGAIFWWGGTINQRVSMLEDHDKQYSSQASDIAVIKSQINDIKTWVDRQQEKDDGQSRQH